MNKTAHHHSEEGICGTFNGDRVSRSASPVTVDDFRTSNIHYLISPHVTTH